MTSPKSIHNQGRVVGYSAYELYVKHYLSDQADTRVPPATEREWLASTLASGASLLLQVPKIGSDDDEVSYYDVQLPRDSRLCAANTIVASFFNGEGELASGSKFAKRIKSYGPLIRNDNHIGPDNTTVPTYTMSDLSENTLLQIRDYIKIIDGIVIQPGDWVDSGSDIPKKLLDPNLSTVPILRFMIKGKIENPFFILLTGFTMRTVVQGESKVDPVFDSRSPSDGDFLGPGSYPWANKIVFSVPNAFIKYFIGANYKRRLPASNDLVVVDDTPIIDMRSSDPASFYQSNYTDARVALDVDRITSPGEGGAVIAIYQRDEVLPPALFAARVTGTGKQHMSPIDTVAPGTIKLFDKSSELSRGKNLEKKAPNNYALLRDPDSREVYQLDIDHDTVVPVAETSTDTSVNLGSDSSNNKNTKLPQVIIRSGKRVGRALSLYKPDGSRYPMSQVPNSSISADKITWLDIISALTRDKSIDLLGKLLGIKSALSTLSDSGKFILNLKNGVVDSLNTLSSVVKVSTGLSKTEGTDGSITLKNTEPDKPIKAGSGIKVSEADGTVTVSNTAPDKPIVAGTGIKVTSKDGKVTVENTAPDKPIKAGTGIKVVNDGKSLIITNIMPNYASGSGFDTIHPGLDYDLKFFNNFTNSYTQAIKNESNYKLFRYPELRTSNASKRSGVMNIKVSESRRDTDNELVSLALSISNNQSSHQYVFAESPINDYDSDKLSSYTIDNSRRYHTKIQHPNLRNVFMLHADDFYRMCYDGGNYVDGFKSVIFRLRFIRDDYLQFAKTAGWSNEPTSGGTGIWNLKKYDDGSGTNKSATMYELSDGQFAYRINSSHEKGTNFGASWQARCALIKLTSGYFGDDGVITQANNDWLANSANTEKTNTAAYNAMKNGYLQLGDLLLVFLQYADGYNTQLYGRPYRNSDIGSHFYSYDMNLSIYGAFSK